MKNFFIGAFMFLASTTVALAYELFVTDVPEPYAVMPIEVKEGSKQMHLGSLEGFPVMYETKLKSQTDLSLQVASLANRPEGQPNYSLMVVKDNENGTGVTEVSRMIAANTEWKVWKDSVYGITWQESEPLILTLEPGVYRIEVSTPVNEGKYALIVGDNSDSAGYFKTLGQIRTTQAHFGFSFIRMLGSSYVYYPLGIILLLFAIHRTWKYRKKISQDVA